LTVEYDILSIFWYFVHGLLSLSVTWVSNSGIHGLDGGLGVANAEIHMLIIIIIISRYILICLLPSFAGDPHFHFPALLFVERINPELALFIAILSSKLVISHSIHCSSLG
jgi:hypothetical protein